MGSRSLVHVLTVIDGKTEELLHLVELKTFTATEFQKQFDVDPEKDPEMMDRYSVGPDDLGFLEKHIGKPLNFDFKRYAYFIEAATKE